MATKAPTVIVTEGQRILWSEYLSTERTHKAVSLAFWTSRGHVTATGAWQDVEGSPSIRRLAVALAGKRESVCEQCQSHPHVISARAYGLHGACGHRTCEKCAHVSTFTGHEGTNPSAEAKARMLCDHERAYWGTVERHMNALKRSRASVKGDHVQTRAASGRNVSQTARANGSGAAQAPASGQGGSEVQSPAPGAQEGAQAPVSTTPTRQEPITLPEMKRVTSAMADVLKGQAVPGIPADVAENLRAEALRAMAEAHAAEWVKALAAMAPHAAILEAARDYVARCDMAAGAAKAAAIVAATPATAARPARGKAAASK